MRSGPSVRAFCLVMHALGASRCGAASVGGARVCGLVGDPAEGQGMALGWRTWPRIGMEAVGAWSCRSVTRKREAHRGMSECLSAPQHVKSREGPGEERACKEEGVRRARAPARGYISRRGRRVRRDGDLAVRPVRTDGVDAGDEGLGTTRTRRGPRGTSELEGRSGVKGSRRGGIKGSPKGTTRGALLPCSCSVI